MFPKMGLTTWSEVCADVPRVMRDSGLLCVVLCTFAEDLKNCIIRAENVEIETVECFDENELGTASLYYLC